MGMSRAEGGVPVRRASCKATGIRIASAPTFFDTMESSITAPAMAVTWVCTVRSRGSSGRIRPSTAPERAMASLTTRAAAMMTTISLAKPSNARSGGTMPISSPTSRAASATRSYARLPQTKKAMVAPISPKASAWCKVI